jgi:hypothetical protein
MTRSGVPWKVSDEVEMQRWVGLPPPGGRQAGRK